MDNRDYANECRYEYIEKMKAQGYEIVYPAPNEIQVDIDTDEHYMLFQKQYDSLVREFPESPGITLAMNPSRNGLPGRHATITMPFDVSDVGRVAWQAALGSDPVRELMSLFRIWRGDIRPTLFVENPHREKGVF